MSDSADWMSEVVDQIYEAALHPEHWQKVVEMLANHVCGGTTIFSHDLSGRSALMFKHHNLTQATVDGYDAHYGTVNPWSPEMQRRPAWLVVHGDHRGPTRDLQRTEFYADWLRPQQLASSFGVTLLRDSRFLTNIAVMLEPDRTEQSADDMNVLQAWVPHLQRTLRIHHQINLPRAERNTLLDMLEKAGCAALTVASDARVLSLTASAEALLGRKNGLTVQMGVLAAMVASRDMRLKAAIRSAADGFGGDYLSIP